ncbi:hypothetical protein GF367_04495 [Candidatus Woesearchaeota archaeon]|nr:hypothetical protein [Candidatus Woesearchaeota archaeon]
MEEDISKNTLLVLVVLTIIISLLGTWTVISETVKVQNERAPTTEEQETTGRVSIDVAPPPPAPVGATGQVTIKII